VVGGDGWRLDRGQRADDGRSRQWWAATGGDSTVGSERTVGGAISGGATIKTTVGVVPSPCHTTGRAIGRPFHLPSEDASERKQLVTFNVILIMC
jgi:hypothetical protein